MAGLEQAGRISERVLSREGRYYGIVSGSSFGDGRVDRNMHPLLLFLCKYICSVFRIIRIRLHKYCLAAHFYIAYASTATHSMFFIYINANVCVPFSTLVFGYHRCTWYYYPVSSLLSLLPEGLKLVESK